MCQKFYNYFLLIKAVLNNFFTFAFINFNFPFTIIKLNYSFTRFSVNRNKVAKILFKFFCKLSISCHWHVFYKTWCRFMKLLFCFIQIGNPFMSTQVFSAYRKEKKKTNDEIL